MQCSKSIFSAKFLKSKLNYIASARYCCPPIETPTKEKGPKCDKKGLVVCVHEQDKKFELTSFSQKINAEADGKIAQKLNEINCGELKLGRAVTFTDLLPGYSTVAITSIGPKNVGYNNLEHLDEARENVRWGVGAAVRKLRRRSGCGRVDVAVDDCVDAAAEAAELAAWRFQKFKAEEHMKHECHVSQYGSHDAELWKKGIVGGQAQNWARYLSDMPANKLTPMDLAQEALNVLCPLGINVEVFDREWIEAQRMEAFLTVARGSCEEPVFLQCSYNGTGDSSAPVLLVAKGVTFDSGGLCLKHCDTMAENRGSMAGAAVALAALRIIATLKVPVKVVCVIPICENMISGQCMKVGDVVHALNGMSIQIEHTDMEGRLMMADALVYGQTVHKPSLVVDVATFTRGVLTATGGGAYGCFANDERAWAAMRRAGAAAGDRPWRFPLWHYFHKLVTNDPSVDLRNKGAGQATPCLGAAFLRNFICGPWLHLDITGVGKVAHAGAPPYLDRRRMTGRPARALAHLLAQPPLQDRELCTKPN